MSSSLKPEKEEYVNKLETTATQYKKPNQKMIDQYLQFYKNAKENKDIKACYLGVDKQFRIISRDSYISTLTDPENNIYIFFCISETAS